MNFNAWKQQFAIRMPNGELFCQDIQVPMTDEEIAASEDLTTPSAQRDMMAHYAGVFGYVAHGKTKSVPTPVIFENRADAEKAANHVAQQAAQYGVDCWGGSVVERLCTPFTSNDPAHQFAHEIADWLTQQGGHR